MRSLSEKYIADFLFTHKVSYEYERPLFLNNQKIKPDFYLPVYNAYIEFWGMLDDHNPEYWKSFRWKVDQYRKHKIRFIPLRSEDLPNLEKVFEIKLQQVLGTRK